MLCYMTCYVVLRYITRYVMFLYNSYVYVMLCSITCHVM